MPSPGQTISTSVRNLGVQATLVSPFFDQFTGTGTPTTNASNQGFTAAGYVITDGCNGAIYWDLWENNVAAGGAVIIEGAPLLTIPSGAMAGAAGSVNTQWVPVGYYTIVAGGVAQTSLARAQGAVTLVQNTLTRLQVLDAYPFMRARVTANGSSASLSASLYAVPS